eukprot:scaffold7901_cov104-Isochrysis_galbana.AAC.2
MTQVVTRCTHPAQTHSRSCTQQHPPPPPLHASCRRILLLGGLALREIERPVRLGALFALEEGRGHTLRVAGCGQLGGGGGWRRRGP